VAHLRGENARPSRSGSGKWEERDHRGPQGSGRRVGEGGSRAAPQSLITVAIRNYGIATVAACKGKGKREKGRGKNGAS
jgi:hypothetical protein